MAAAMNVLVRSLFPGVDFATPETALKTAFPSVDIPQMIASVQAVVAFTETMDARMTALEIAVKELTEEIRSGNRYSRPTDADRAGNQCDGEYTVVGGL